MEASQISEPALQCVLVSLEATSSSRMPFKNKLNGSWHQTLIKLAPQLKQQAIPPPPPSQSDFSTEDTDFCLPAEMWVPPMQSLQVYSPHSSIKTPTVCAALGGAVQGAMLPADTRLPLVVSVSENTDPAEEKRKKDKEESHSVILRFILGCCHPLIHFHQWQDCSCNGRQRKRLNFATKT